MIVFIEQSWHMETLKILKCNYLDEETNKPLSWANTIRQLLQSYPENGLSISFMAKEMYGEDNAIAHIKAQKLICRQREKLEKDNNQILVVDDGAYRLTNKEEGALAVGNLERRRQSVITKIETFDRGYNIILEQYPEQAELVERLALAIVEKAIRLRKRQLVIARKNKK